MSMNRRTGVYVAVLVVGALAYVGVELLRRHRAEQALAEETVDNAVANVSVIHAQPLDAIDAYTMPGNIEAWYQAPIYAQVSGYVKAWYKDYGAIVKKGDVLAEINVPMVAAQFNQAKANVEAQRAAANLALLYAKRYGAMRSTNALSEQAIATKEADARVQEAQLAAAEQAVRNFEAQMKFRIIVAPYDGVVIARNINVGDYVNHEGNSSDDAKGTNLFTVADIHKMRLFVSVPESFGQFLKPGLQADVTVPQFPDCHFKADFLTVARGFGVSTRTAVTEFIINNDDHALWPGSYASVRILAKLNRAGLRVSSNALVFAEKGSQLATVTKDNKVHFKDITITKILDGEIEIAGGVTAEDAIVDNPSASLLEGDPVHVVTPARGYKLAAEAPAE